MNSELTVAVHCLLYLDSREERMANSEQIACSVATHPARVRKVLSLLRRHDLVTTKEGAHGGYQLKAELSQVSLGDLYRIFAQGSLRPSWCSGSEHSSCNISSNIPAVMNQIYGGAEQQVELYFNRLSLSEVKRLLRESEQGKGEDSMSLENQEVWLFYTGSYAESGEPGIHLCELRRSTGEMRVLHGFSGLTNPSFVALDAMGLRLYAVSEQSEGRVAGFAVDPGDGKLTLLSGDKATLGADPCHLALQPGPERHLLVANYSSGHVNAYALESDGAPGDMTSLIRHEGSSVNKERQESAHAHSAVPSLDGRFAFVSDLGTDQIVIYRLECGQFVKHGTTNLPPGAGPRHFVIHPSERFAYGMNELNNTMTAYALDPEEGRLEVIQHASSLPDDFQGENYPADIHFSPDGRFVYGSNRGHDSIVRFHIDPATGRLEDPAWASAGGSWPRNFAVLDDYVLVANQYSGNVAALRRDPENGRLTPTEQSLKLAKPSCIEPLSASLAAGMLK
ncbi:beta-propeller fold lactonase family protein [Paenibacillus rubinfantis]|uniref:beta-propeller fold lactonase family protein n=1 Tax=Paenibacillus rubinfantis TaxID=1720296 RepID=UPI0009E6EAFA|nr:beta-propeller fold lactonase family protein [Paenibacillus rubinfantis]